MPGTLTMNDKQKAAAGITILDQDGQPLDALPTGVTAAFKSSDPTVADFAVGPDGMNGEITSGKVGTATVGVDVTFEDGKVVSDQIVVAVTNSAPGAVNFTAGEPVDE